jgi:hypothetical protein
MTTRTPWTDQENAALVALYFAMLDKAITGQSYNKAAMIRAARGIHSGVSFGPLCSRSRGSIEAKLMNASAAHRDISGAVITMNDHGYRCLSNYQKSLKVAMQTVINARSHTLASRLQHTA